MYSEEYKSVKDTSAVRLVILHFLKGIAWAAVFTAVIFVLCALVLTYTPVPESALPAIVIVTAVISIVIAGMTASKGARSKGYLNGAGAGLSYVLLLYFISALAGNGFYFNAYFLVMLLAGIFAGAFGGILGINLSDKRKR